MYFLKCSTDRAGDDRKHVLLLIIDMFYDGNVDLLVQVWRQRGRRCSSVTSGRPGRRSNRPKRTQSSPPFLRISGEGWRWGLHLSFFHVGLMLVSLKSSGWMIIWMFFVLPPAREHILEQHWLSRFYGVPLGSQVHVYPFAVFLQQAGKSSDICTNHYFAVCSLSTKIKTAAVQTAKFLLCLSACLLSQSKEVPPPQSIENAHVLLFLGNKVTTDHISPAGSIARVSAAAKYLLNKRSVSYQTPGRLH